MLSSPLIERLNHRNLAYVRLPCPLHDPPERLVCLWIGGLNLKPQYVQLPGGQVNVLTAVPANADRDRLPDQVDFGGWIPLDRFW